MTWWQDSIGYQVYVPSYQGEELGLADAAIAPDEVQDPPVRSGGGTIARDAVRTPMPGRPGPGHGFTAADRAWIAFGERVAADTVAVQVDDPGSPLSAHRRLLGLHRSHADLRHGPVEWLDAPASVLA